MRLTRVPVDTERKPNGRSEDVQDVLCTFNLRPVSTEVF